MISTEDLIASIAEETRIIKHLFDKVTDENIDWRPNEHQRSIRELLQYHLRMGVMIPVFLETGYNSDTAKQMKLDTEAADLNDFPALMDEQLELVTEFLENYSEEDLNEEIDLFGM
ncbi:MAG: hypothetical protein H6765_04270 [Candidatus Peribacteria bacterium]|nr:MAG: hypothetical protein H6765_04270 [Candidatus Peribacteria bacterium]